MPSKLKAAKAAWKRYPWLGLQAAKSGVERGVFSHAEAWVREDEVMRLHASGIKYDKTTGMITGAATKPGEYVVKFTKSGAETEEMTISVGPMPKIEVVPEGDTDGCKVTGMGAYLVGKTVSLKVSASGCANVGGMREGAIMADFAPVVTVNKAKKVLSIKTNLWFDRSNSHEDGAGSAVLAE